MVRAFCSAAISSHRSVMASPFEAKHTEVKGSPLAACGQKMCIRDSMRTVGTTSRGVRCPVIREGDDLVKIVTDAVLACSEEQAIAFQDKDIVAVTEAVVDVYKRQE